MGLREGFNIDKDLLCRLDSLLKDGSLDKETEILRMLEVLSKKIKLLENKEEAAKPCSSDSEVPKEKLHRKWGQHYF